MAFHGLRLPAIGLQFSSLRFLASVLVFFVSRRNLSGFFRNQNMWMEDDDAILTPTMVSRYRSNWNVIEQIVFLGKFSGQHVKERFNHLQRLEMHRNNTSKQLNQQLLGTLDKLVTALVNDKVPSSFNELLAGELSSLISGSDLPAAARALEYCCTLLQKGHSQETEEASLAVRTIILPKALSLVKSPLLEDPALTALLQFFEALGDYARQHFNTLRNMLISHGEAVPEKAVYNIASCLGALCLRVDDEQCSATVEMLLTTLGLERVTNDKKQNLAPVCLGESWRTSVFTADNIETLEEKQHIALVCLGEIGRTSVLTADNIETVMVRFLKYAPHRIKSAASYALGNLAVGNQARFLPFILDQIENQYAERYMFLQSLKEVLVRHSNLAVGNQSRFLPFILDQIENQHAERYMFLQSLKVVLVRHNIVDFSDLTVLQMRDSLLNWLESKDNAVSDTVAKCLGELALIKPEMVIEELKARMRVNNPLCQCTIVNALRLCTVQDPHRVDDELKSVIPELLKLMKHNEEIVRHCIILSLTTFAEHKPNLLSGYLQGEMLIAVYEQTTVENDEDTRKASFGCLLTLLKNCGEQINPEIFIRPYLKDGLKDDVVMYTCHDIIKVLANLFPKALLRDLDALVESLETTICFKPKDYARATQHMEDERRTRSTLAAISSVDSIDGSGYSSGFKTLKMKMSQFAALSELYRSVRYK